MNMKKILSLIFLLLIICTPVLADIQIGEFIITDETTSEEIILYIFQILIGIGALIAVAMVIIAGIEWMTSDGNPGKIGGAKTKIKNALLGVGVLLGSYLILYTINPQIVDVEIEELTCNYGIIVNTAEPPKKEVIRCVDISTGKIGYDIYETINEDKWDFPSGSILKVFAYAGENYTGERTIFEMDDEGNISGDISGAKSIYFLRNHSGIYLYDDVNYGLNTAPYPLYTSTSIADLSKFNFNNKTQSIEIINPPEEGTYNKYSVVLFTSQNYEGMCSLLTESLNTLDAAATSNYSVSIKNNNVSSLIVQKSVQTVGAIEPYRGQVIFYTTKNCGRPQQGGMNLPTVGSVEIKQCEVSIEAVPKHLNILDVCPDWEEGDAVLSFEIIGNAGLVLNTAERLEAGEIGTTCKYFDVSSLGGGTCYADISGTSVYNIWGRKPQSYIIISAD
ncbi:MAG: hypothetical protein XE08_0557 [Parcubacteria bacterium 32_520]|nr:MAG: hypothetical protein XE08_0557 [Parcubacteria bacterium 32_520]